MSERRIDERDLEALAHGRRDLASEEGREAAGDEAIAAWLEREREASREASVALKRAAPALDDLDAMISAAMAKAPEAPEGAPTRKSLAIGAAIGAIVAVASGALSIAASDPRALASETWGDLSSGARLLLTLGTTLDRLASHVPGGWAGMAIAGLLLVSALMIPLRVIVGPLRRAGGAAATLVAVGVVGTGLLGTGGVARAYDLEGEWPAEDARASVDVDRAPRSEALRQACASAGVGLAYSLESDPPVTLHVHDAPLREVLDALLLDEAARVRHTGHLIVVRPAAPAPAQGATQPPGPVPPQPPIDAPPQPPSPIAPPPPAAPPPVPAAVPAVPAAPPVIATELRDLVTFGGDARVLPDQQVRDVITMGGDARIEGQAFGNVVTMGGDADVDGMVVGDVVTMGGDIRVTREGRVHGQLNAMGGDIEVAEPETRAQQPAAGPGIHIATGSIDAASGHTSSNRDGGDRRSWIGETLDSLMKHALLFLLGLLFMGLAPARMSTLQRQMIQQPLRALASGFLGMIAAAVLTLVLVITIVGIPGAIVLALGGFLAAYLGLATAASVLGAALPIPALKDRPVLQLAVGIVLLFVVSRVPVVGALLGFFATMIGLGAVLITRAGQRLGSGIASGA